MCKIWETELDRDHSSPRGSQEVWEGRWSHRNIGVKFGDVPWNVVVSQLPGHGGCAELLFATRGFVL